MRSLIKIYSKYIGMAWIISFLFLIINGVLFLVFSLNRFESEQDKGYLGIRRLEEFADIAVEQDGAGKFQITEAGIEYMEQRGLAFLLILDDAGEVVARWNEPEGFPQHYTTGEIAAFSKWYLNDYPVGVWRLDGGVLVLGYPKDSLWKYNVEMPRDFFDQFSVYFKIEIIGNILFVLTTVIFLGYRYYRSMKPMTEGLELLAANKRVFLSEKGVTSELAGQINRASEILEEQRRTLQTRDHARTEWIAGVSHDIRTPLSVIMGYADELEGKESISEEDRKKAEIMKGQVLQIKQLIEDLNLTSKLAYQMQPLRIEAFSLAPVLRSLIAERINEGLDEKYRLIPEIDASAQECRLKADKALLSRAVRNLINNSIRHNPDGCTVWIEAGLAGEGLMIAVSDNGRGIPAEIVGLLLEQGTDFNDVLSVSGIAANQKKPHIMGLRIVKQVALAHKGRFGIEKNGHRVSIWLPVS